MWSLPAQPTVSASSLVPSRLTSRRPETRDGSSAFAPSRPCSSETVKRSSSGPWAIPGSSATASAAATPMPLSAPSVVSSRDHPVVLDHNVDPTLARVVLAPRLALADHVEVRLEDDRRRRLASRRRRHADDDVALGVRRRLEVARVRPREHVVTCSTLVLGRTRDPRELVEALPDERGLEAVRDSPTKREDGADARERRARARAASRPRSARRRTSRAGRSPSRARTAPRSAPTSSPRSRCAGRRP